MPTATLPSLSEVRAFAGDYLIDAAQHWADSAGRWTVTYDDLLRDVTRPTVWQGNAADAAALRVGTDRHRVTGAADDLAAAAAVARRAADDLLALKTRLLNTVRTAQAAGFIVGEDFSLTTIESTSSTVELAAREAQMRKFGAAIRSDVLALVAADEQAAAQITMAASQLRSLTLTDDGAAIQDVDFRGIPLPEKPNPPAVPPAEGWSTDPLIRAAQKIAYGHALDKHGHEFGYPSQEEFAELIYQKMLRAINDPGGLILGLSEDGAPVIYDPEENVLIIRDTRPNAPDGGTAYKPNNPAGAPRKIETPLSRLTAEQLGDGPKPRVPTSDNTQAKLGSAPPSADSAQAGATAPRAIHDRPGPGFLENWGTHVPPEELAKIDGPLGILGRIILGQVGPNPDNPKNWA
ncbi:hypothetical protein CQY20_33360 [Mycolicibacterium agri]|uniref:Uncharacterized protein n=1 Tax=Mycolicibacterium agri TaxID=36811 RepID=A0A2A7MN43_MYCAG|nr:hypothetical protein [Mycolicibacterium agri]PEG32970.1 hypothetical protein CQY20_33360 [Mycolicibacterium agri]GFG51055.1 hypothetical protein MAGR_24960 [Mycolicibacterium agri]